MEKFKENCLEEIKKLEGSRTSKVITKVKYDRLVAVLKRDVKDKNLIKHIKAKKYRLINLPDLGLTDVLAKEQKDENSLLRVVHTETMFDVVQSVHVSNEQMHSSATKVENHIKNDFYGIPRSYIRFHIKQCPTCQLSSVSTSKPPIKPIIESDFLSRIQVDLIDLKHSPDGEYHYIGHVIDHFSKYHILFPLKTKSATEVAIMIQERVFAYLGLPKIFHSDNGREFVNEILKRVFEMWGGDTLFVNGRPRHSQSQGCVERGNRTVQSKIGKLIQISNSKEVSEMINDLAAEDIQDGETYPWASWLPNIMYALNSQMSETTKTSPYELVFGQKARGNVFPGAKTGVLHEEDVTSAFAPVPPVPAPRKKKPVPLPQVESDSDDDFIPVPPPRKRK